MIISYKSLSIVIIFMFALVCGGAYAAPLQCPRQGCIGRGHDALLSLMQQCQAEFSQGSLRCPCVALDITSGADTGYLLLKDCRGRSQFLLIPTALVTGIEDPILLRTNAPNYFARAWQNRFLVEQMLGRRLASDQISLALNPQSGRSQNQLHIHIDCLAGDVRQLLLANQKSMATDWQPLSKSLRGHVYRALRVPGDSLVANPVALLFSRLAQEEGAGRAQQEMGRHSLLLTGAQFADGPGFVLLDSKEGAAEELQDHECADIL